MLTRTLRPALLLLAPLTFTLACSDDESDSRDYVTVDVKPTTDRATAVGSTTTVHFEHFFVDVPDAGCEDGCGGGQCSDQYLPINSRLVEATCAGDGPCDAAAVRTSAGQWDVTVRAQLAGTYTVRAVLATPDGATYEGHTLVRFATPTALAISYPWMTSPWTSVYASLPGAVRKACVDVVGADGLALHADPNTVLLVAGGMETYAADIAGSSWPEPPARCDRIVAPASSGTFPATYVLGDLSATVPVHVVWPDDVTAVSVFDVDDVEQTGDEYVGPDVDVLATATTVGRLDVSCPYGPDLFVRFETASGVAGIADARSAVSFAPAGLAELATMSARPDSPVAIVDPRGNGDGVLRAQVGSATTDIPLHVEGCGTRVETDDDAGTTDAGADADSDAGIDGGDGG
jgi:hypothetical protein